MILSPEIYEQVNDLLKRGWDTTRIADHLGWEDADLIYEVSRKHTYYSSLAKAEVKWVETAKYRQLPTCHTMIMDIIAQLYKQQSPLRILEYGCGDGFSARKMGAAFPDCQIHGIDLIGASIEEARKKALPNTIFWQADGYKFEAQQPYDLVYHLNVLEHVNDKSAYLSKSLSALKPNGYLIVGYPKESYWRFWGLPKYVVSKLLSRPFQTHACPDDVVELFIKRQPSERILASLDWGLYMPRRVYGYVPNIVLPWLGRGLSKVEYVLAAFGFNAPMMFSCKLVGRDPSPAMKQAPERKGLSGFIKMPAALLFLLATWVFASCIMALEVVSGRKTFFRQR